MPSLSRFGDTIFPPYNYRAGFPQDLFKASFDAKYLSLEACLRARCSSFSIHSSFDLPEFLSELVVSEAPGLHSECNSSHRNLYNDENCRLGMQIQEKYFNFKLIVSSSCRQIVHYSPPAQIALETWSHLT